MRKRAFRLAAMFASVAVLCSAASLANAQSPLYAITSSGVSGLSATSIGGGSFAVRGSVQEVARQAMTGGDYSVIGGIAPPPAAGVAGVYLPYVKQ